jgi:threonine/homoserine/homoserine lactone efflux protein
MEELSFAAKGLVLGFAIAAPVGPIGLLCIRRTLSGGMAMGLASGMGAATADAFYGALAGFGVAAVTDLLIGWQDALRLAGGLFLLWLAVSTFRASPAGKAARAEGAAGMLGAWFSTALLTIANPATILSFVAVFGSLGLVGAESGGGAAASLVAGVFAGSALWWLLLCGGVALARERVGGRGMVAINRVSGLVLAGFAVHALAGLAS